ncbi:bifunctional diguanylate cyclase/phosphodiesterase [Ectobacillus antri]|jgi:diguanylate cyclase (GGDEF)-like protein/PAS domain S-box-containing protein|uniref:bifunctional diguanylate cyclase/phosphodiesterase n=1 Tax=Ectobacillus antri TaxID=2486280 RepID=UPI000F58F63D|nr:EAL domain-containing protein [Ectobacillus antri]
MRTSQYQSSLKRHSSRPSLQFTLNKKTEILDINEDGLVLLGWELHDILGSSLLSFVHSEDRESVASYFQMYDSHEYISFRILSKQQDYVLVQQYARLIEDSEGHLHFFATLAQFHRQTEDLLSGQQKLLELIAKGMALPLILDEIIYTAEQIQPDIIGSILLLKEGRLYHGAAPKLPDTYTHALNGVRFGPGIGSCGTAAYLKQLIIVEDISTDPYWEHYKDLALTHGLKSCWSLPIFSSNNEVLGTFAIYHTYCKKPSQEDIEFFYTFSYLAGLAIEQTEIKQARDESEQRYKSLFDQNINAVISLDLEGRCLDVNEAALALGDFTRKQFINTYFTDWIVKEDLASTLELFEKTKDGASQSAFLRLLKADKQIVHLNVTFIPILVDHKVTGIYVMAADITERMKQEETIRHMAYYDALTSLPNRRLFYKRIEEAVLANKPFSILYMDVDRFKYINDSLGHNIGDKLLVHVGDRLQQSIGKDGNVFRLGGDEFTIFTIESNHHDSAIYLAKKLLQAFEPAFVVDDFTLHVTPSIGISRYPQDGTDVETLLKHADIAMYNAKKSGKNQYRTYQPSTQLPAPSPFLLHDLYEAINHDSLTVLYQPIMNITTNTVTAAEALVRWKHPKLGLISPNLFIPLAEEMGMITTIDIWMIRQACKQIDRLMRLKLASIRISVNISVKSLYKPNFAKCVIAILEEFSLPPHSLVLEIREGVFMQKESVVISNLQELQGYGISFSIDDFGTGYSSLASLERIPAQTIKIAKSFIDCLPSPGYGTIITSTLLSLAQQLNMTVIAEGVESVDQLTYLKEHACQYAQGFLISPPVIASHLEQMLSYQLQKTDFILPTNTT